MQNYSCNFHKHTVLKNTPRFSWQTIQNEIQRTTGQLSNVTSYWAWSSTVCLQRTYQLAFAVIFNWQDLDPTPLSFSSRTLLHIMYLVWLVLQRVPPITKGSPHLCKDSHFVEVPTFCQALFFRWPLAVGSHFWEGGHSQRAPIFHRVVTGRGISFCTGLPLCKCSHFFRGQPLCHGSHFFFKCPTLQRVPTFAEGSTSSAQTDQVPQHQQHQTTAAQHTLHQQHQTTAAQHTLHQQHQTAAAQQGHTLHQQGHTLHQQHQTAAAQQGHTLHQQGHTLHQHQTTAAQHTLHHHHHTAAAQHTLHQHQTTAAQYRHILHQHQTTAVQHSALTTSNYSCKTQPHSASGTFCTNNIKLQLHITGILCTNIKLQQYNTGTLSTNNIKLQLHNTGTSKAKPDHRCCQKQTDHGTKKIQMN